VTLAARERGAVIRPLGDVMVLMPALSMTADELRRLVKITAAAITAATVRITSKALTSCCLSSLISPETRHYTADSKCTSTANLLAQVFIDCK